ncbi:MAG TPA: PaaI family thioesterase [Bacteroidetes bacterium]|nr:PaaI family thioesterase [Bacteroidota bacterium]
MPDKKIHIPFGKYFHSFVSDGEKERIKIDYFFNPEDGRVSATVIFGPLAQGPPNHAHGGATASVLDESMGAVAWLNGFPVMTVRMTIDFLKAVKLNSELNVAAWIDRVDENKVWLKSKITDENGTVFVKAKGLFLKLPKEKFQKMGAIPDQFFEMNRFSFKHKL